MKIRSIILLLFASANMAYGEISSVEQKIVASVHKDFDESIQFLEKIVNINSGTQNLEGVKRVGDEFDAAFRSIGFTTRWISKSDVNRAGHFFAEYKGKGKGKRILLIGHLDTVFEKASPFQKFERNGNIITGPGVNDMKGGDVVILYALKALHSSGALDKASSIIVAFTGDEEDPGDPVEIARQELVDAAKRSDIALGFETAVSLDVATVARRGVSEWVLKVTATQGHSSGIFNEKYGSGAIFDAARILNAFHEQLRGEQFLSFNPGIIVGGTEVTFDPAKVAGTASGKSNIIAKEVYLKGDLRFISDVQRKKAIERMKEIVAKNIPPSTAEIQFISSYPAMSPTPGNDAVLQTLDKVSQDLGYGPVKAYDPGKRGAADISFVASYVDCLDGLGALGEGAHTPKENADLEKLRIITKRTAVLIYRLFQQ